jgi:hypothetical protein
LRRGAATQRNEMAKSEGVVSARYVRAAAASTAVIAEVVLGASQAKSQVVETATVLCSASGDLICFDAPQSRDHHLACDKCIPVCVCVCARVCVCVCVCVSPEHVFLNDVLCTTHPLTQTHRHARQVCVCVCGGGGGVERTSRRAPSRAEVSEQTPAHLPRPSRTT